MMKSISILGSTGSIGLSTLKIIDKKKSFFKIILLSANSNIKLIIQQIIKYKPKYFVVTNLNTYKLIKKKFNKKNTKILNNFNKINFKNKTDIVISAIPGYAGLEPTLNIIKFCKKILIANKESIICGWNLIKVLSDKYKTKIIPVDSEHYSIFKLLENHKVKDVKKIYITASGGPFLNYNVKKLKKVTPNEALKHPKWKMGKKISINSSTLMNKILELIEAQKLFSIPSKKLDILIHPDSLVHAIIKFNNGLTKFIYHETSMIIPLANAIFDGNLNMDDFFEAKGKKNIKNLTFKSVDKKIFPVIRIKSRINEYPSTPIIINSSNETLVDHFLAKKTDFLSINKIIMTILNNRNYKKYAIRKPNSINKINEIHQWAKNLTTQKIFRK
jgi:1-deoxy-D-xylulose-5-phosphate reductoisomerase